MRIFGIAQNRIAGVLGVVGIAVLAFASASTADSTVTMKMTGVGNGANGVGQGTTVDSSKYGVDVYVDPYFATVSGLGSNVPVICDDWSADTSMGEQWSANVTNAASVAGGSGMFGNTPSAQPLYNEAVWLATQIMSSYNSQNYTAEAEYTFALWELTYGPTNNAAAPSPSAFLASASGLPSNFLSMVASDLSTAQGMGSFNASGWEILTPTTEGQPGAPQEFLVQTPEPSTILMLGLGLGAMLVMWRRKRNAGSSPMAIA